MTSQFTVACVQNSAIDDVAHNIRDVSELVRQAAGKSAEFVCLPEYFACLEKTDTLYLERGYRENDHPALAALRELAAELNIWMLLGSLAIKISDTKVNNRSYLVNAKGEIVETYDKIHLFDVVLKEGEAYKESNIVVPGDRAKTAELPWGTLGFSVCYDVRFPHLYRQLAQAGAQMLTIPAAFTATTGRAHWHVLVRSRAIETGCYVFAPGQCGKRPWGRRTYGHSIVVDPWGEVLCDGGEDRGIVLAEVDLDKVAEARRMIPALTHDRVIKDSAC
ncbi:MAG: carbon-nitrogen hydrolase family protein [Proteobacteria bacterium]|nr:carbon-nitrogen hydrolase family protein [Pseudomonadota bacterium]